MRLAVPERVYLAAMTLFASWTTTRPSGVAADASASRSENMRASAHAAILSIAES